MFDLSPVSNLRYQTSHSLSLLQTYSIRDFMKRFPNQKHTYVFHVQPFNMTTIYVLIEPHKASRIFFRENITGLSCNFREVSSVGSWTLPLLFQVGDIENDRPILGSLIMFSKPDTIQINTYFLYYVCLRNLLCYLYAERRTCAFFYKYRT